MEKESLGSPTTEIDEEEGTERRGIAKEGRDKDQTGRGEEKKGLRTWDQKEIDRGEKGSTKIGSRTKR